MTNHASLICHMVEHELPQIGGRGGVEGICAVANCSSSHDDNVF